MYLLLFLMGNLSWKLNPIWMEETIISLLLAFFLLIKPLSADKTIEITRRECKQNTRNNMLDASISSWFPCHWCTLILYRIQPPLRETYIKTICHLILNREQRRKREQWERFFFSQEHTIIHQFECDRYRSHSKWCEQNSWIIYTVTIETNQWRCDIEC